MRLLDQVVRSPKEVTARDPTGRPHRLTAGGAKAGVIESCGLRYILDRNASQQCFELVTVDTGLLLPDSNLLRLPAEIFWLEWYLEPDGASGVAPRRAVLVEAAPDGRSGTITSFFEDQLGRADLIVLSTEFDLDHLLEPARHLGTSFRARHDTYPHLNPLFQHALFELDPGWAAYLRATKGAGFRQNLETLVDAAWGNLPFVLAFSAMLNSNGVLERRTSDLATLNKARTKIGKPPLLDHVEVRLRLGQPEIGAYGIMNGHRTAPRLHHVRGHLVHRAGKTFWRTSHLRGDAERPIAKKTVSVTAAPRAPIAWVGAQSSRLHTIGSR